MGRGFGQMQKGYFGTFTTCLATMKCLGWLIVELCSLTNRTFYATLLIHWLDIEASLEYQPLTAWKTFFNFTYFGGGGQKAGAGILEPLLVYCSYMVNFILP